ncbi:MAG: hypothetical protein ACKODZ_00195 [Verrucomicrobiota bacterium]
MNPIISPRWMLASGFALVSACGWLTEGWAQRAGTAFSEELQAKAENGDADSQFQIGNCYFFGLGVPKKQIDGVNWYR